MAESLSEHRTAPREVEAGASSRAEGEESGGARRGRVFVHGRLAGTVEEREDVFAFTYDAAYLADVSAPPVSLTMPLRPEPYESKTFLPFFDGLIPEGWLLDLAARHWKLDRRDRMGLLLAACEDCIGAVHVVEEQRARALESS